MRKLLLMKSWGIVVLMLCLFFPGSLSTLNAQCSICSRSAQQLGEKPAKALNTGILYLASAPLLIAGFIGYRWMKNAR